MHYYKRNLGDYAKKAGRLSMLQHGAYTLLIDACYDREDFPTESQAIDWAWASTPEEEQAVKFVLSRFFVLNENGVFVQPRVHEELQIYKAGEISNRLIALSREAKKQERSDFAKDCDQLRAKIKHDPLQISHAAWTELLEALIKEHEPPPNHKPLTINHKPLTINQEPLTTNQEPIKESEKPSAKKPASVSTLEKPPPPNGNFLMPLDWEPDPETWEGNATLAGCPTDYSNNIQEFRLYWSSEMRRFTERQWQGKLINDIKRNYQKTKFVKSDFGVEPVSHDDIDSLLKSRKDKKNKDNKNNNNDNDGEKNR